MSYVPMGPYRPGEGSTGGMSTELEREQARHWLRHRRSLRFAWRAGTLGRLLRLHSPGACWCQR